MVLTTSFSFGSVRYPKILFFCWGPASFLRPRFAMICFLLRFVGAERLFILDQQPFYLPPYSIRSSGVKCSWLNNQSVISVSRLSNINVLWPILSSQTSTFLGGQQKSLTKVSTRQQFFLRTSTKWHKPHIYFLPEVYSDAFFIAPALKDQACIVLLVSICLFLYLSVCPKLNVNSYHFPVNPKWIHLEGSYLLRRHISSKHISWYEGQGHISKKKAVSETLMFHKHILLNWVSCTV